MCTIATAGPCTYVPTNFNKPFFIFLQMSRKYERKTDRESWDEEKMALAIEDVKSKSMDSLKSAETFSVAKTTLKKMMKIIRTNVPRGQEIVRVQDDCV